MELKSYFGLQQAEAPAGTDRALRKALHNCHRAISFCREGAARDLMYVSREQVLSRTVKTKLRTYDSQDSYEI
jgi:hypothetical protein